MAVYQGSISSMRRIIQSSDSVKSVFLTKRCHTRERRLQDATTTVVIVGAVCNGTCTESTRRTSYTDPGMKKTYTPIVASTSTDNTISDATGDLSESTSLLRERKTKMTETSPIPIAVKSKVKACPGKTAIRVMAINCRPHSETNNRLEKVSDIIVVSPRYNAILCVSMPPTHRQVRAPPMPL